MKRPRHWPVREALEEAARYLAEKGITTPRADAELLLATLLESSRTELITHPETGLSREQAHRFQAWIEERGRHFPIQYLRGVQEFYGRDFVVSPATLIPRPETELLVEAALQVLGDLDDPAPRLLDVGCGSGCLAVTLALEDPRLCTTALDISLEALQLSRHNADRLGCRQRLEFLQGDGPEVLLPLGRRFHLIVSNPPYVANSEIVESSVHFEPRQAVFAGPTGMEFYERLLRTSQALLEPSGVLILELGFGRRPAAEDRARHYGWQVVSVKADLSGIDRCLVLSAG